MFKDNSRDLRNEKLTKEQVSEIKTAFDSGVAMCFTVDKANGVASRVVLVRKILEKYPDTLFAKCDMALLGSEPKAYRDMILLIKKDTDKASFNKMVDETVASSGVVSQAIFIGKTNEDGIKKAVKREFAKDKTSVVKIANLLVDGNKLILTVRNNVVVKK